MMAAVGLGGGGKKRSRRVHTPHQRHLQAGCSELYMSCVYQIDNSKVMNRQLNAIPPASGTLVETLGRREARSDQNKMEPGFTEL